MQVPPLPNSLEVQGRALPSALPMHLKKHKNVLKMSQQLCCCGFQMAHLIPISKLKIKITIIITIIILLYNI
jgi:hypothetical protein